MASMAFQQVYQIKIEIEQVCNYSFINKFLNSFKLLEFIEIQELIIINVINTSILNILKIIKKYLVILLVMAVVSHYAC